MRRLIGGTSQATPIASSRETGRRSSSIAAGTAYKTACPSQKVGPAHGLPARLATYASATTMTPHAIPKATRGSRPRGEGAATGRCSFPRGARRPESAKAEAWSSPGLEWPLACARVSPLHNRCIGLALVPSRLIAEKNYFDIQANGRLVRASVHILPFYDPEGVRLKG